MYVYHICTLNTHLFCSLFPHDTLPYIMGIPEIAAPYKINYKYMLLQAAAVVAMIQDKLRCDKKKFRKLSFSLKYITVSVLSEDSVIVLTTYLHIKWHTCGEKRRLFCRMALRPSKCLKSVLKPRTI